MGIINLSQPVDIVKNMPRQCSQHTTRVNHPANTHKQYWKAFLYFVFKYYMKMELESRLISSENHFFAQYLPPHVVKNITYETYETELAYHLDEFNREFARWQAYWCITPHD